ncbi:MAG: hypothetical protein LBR80_05640 [Deltaproteobacteria bacterium]|jgi:hypothetical protein|nr:hypothetical protein [Deltaproteobacteria bacterium]
MEEAYCILEKPHRLEGERPWLRVMDDPSISGFRDLPWPEERDSAMGAIRGMVCPDLMLWGPARNLDADSHFKICAPPASEEPGGAGPGKDSRDGSAVGGLPAH